MLNQTSRLMKSTYLRKIVKARGLNTTCFRKHMLMLAKEFAEEDEKPGEILDSWGHFSVVPAAFSIEREGNVGRGIYDVTVGVYELELSKEIEDEKVEVYSAIADGDGPNISLHIIDKYGRECIADSDHLMRFWSCRIRGAASVREWWEYVRNETATPKSERALKWKAAYDALRELGIRI